MSAAPGRRLRRAAVALLIVGTGLAACSTTGERDAATDTTRPGSTDTSAPGSSTTTTDRTDETDETDDGPDIDPALEDVSDTVFEGLGDPRIDVSHYDVTVRADPGAEGIVGTATLTLEARTADALPAFTLDLRGPTITSVTVAGKPADVVAGDDQVELTPAVPLEPGVEVTVVIGYEGEPANSTFPALGVPVGWQPDESGGWFTMSEPDGTATWVPVNDHPTDKATWTITLDTPADATGVSNGRLVSSAEAGGRREWVWEMDRPMASYLVLGAIGDYDLVTRDGPDDIEITFAYPPGVSAEDRAGFDAIDEMLVFYSEAFGPYPYDDAGAIVVDAAFGLALETQTRPLFGTDGLDASALAHEIAHQWFGDAVSLTDWADLWLNEGFATYADWLWVEHESGTPISVLADAPYVYSSGDLAVTDPRAAASFDGVVYQGGGRALQALRLEVGDDDFFHILRTWFLDNDGANVTTADFIALSEDVSGRDLDEFFARWLDRAEQPDLPG